MLQTGGQDAHVKVDHLKTKPFVSVIQLMRAKRSHRHTLITAQALVAQTMQALTHAYSLTNFVQLNFLKKQCDQVLMEICH